MELYISYIYITVDRSKAEAVEPIYEKTRVSFGKYCFYQKICLMKNIQNLISYKKGSIDFCHQMALSPQNGHALPKMVLQFSFENILFWKNLLNSKIFVT